MAEITITSENFEAEVIKSNIPVVVDFWATWCGPCMMMGKEIEALAEEYTGKIKVGKLNVDEEPALAGQFGIEAIPTVLLFKDGKIANKTIGYMPKEQLVSTFNL